MDIKRIEAVYSLNGDREKDKILTEPITYIVPTSGERVEDTLTRAFNYWLKIPDEKAQIVSDITHTMALHMYSLIDDIQDDSILRNGVPVAHSIYGVSRTLNAAVYGWFIALERVISFKNFQAIEVFSEQVLELHRGQGMEIYWRDTFTCPTEAEYKVMAIEKTAGFFNLAVRLMQVFSNCKTDFTPLVKILGLYFHIRDDYTNLCDEECSDSKGFCDDITDGKFGFPLLHGIKAQENGGQILHILRQRTKNIEVKKYCVNLLDKLGSFAYTRKIMSDLDQQARVEITRLGGNPHLINVLDKLLNWKINPID